MNFIRPNRIELFYEINNNYNPNIWLYVPWCDVIRDDQGAAEAAAATAAMLPSWNCNLFHDFELKFVHIWYHVSQFVNLIFDCMTEGNPVSITLWRWVNYNDRIIALFQTEWY